MGCGALIPKLWERSEPKFMKILNAFKKKYICCFRTVIFLLLGAGLTGCAGREAEFFEEIREMEAEEETSESKEEMKPQQEEKMEEEAEKTKEKEGKLPAETKPARIYVDVCGAVAQPGVFKLTEGDRVFQAIEAAGGCLPEAAQEYINKAGFLSDGQQIYIPTREETQQGDFSGVEMSDAENTVNSKESPQESRVNINTAGEEELTTLTGIGATRAKAIISYREENGPFFSIEDIMNVQGIKEGTFAKIKDKIIAG